MARLFIGGLNDSISRGELEKEFTSFGHIEDCFVARNPPGFGFIVYEKSRDAEKAIKEMDGTMCCGSRIRVQHPRERGVGHGSGGGYGGSARGILNIKCFNCGGFGHISRDCSRSSQYGYSCRGGGGRRSRPRSRSFEREQQRRRRRSPSRSRSISRDRMVERTVNGKTLFDESHMVTRVLETKPLDWAESHGEIDYNEKLEFDDFDSDGESTAQRSKKRRILRDI